MENSEKTSEVKKICPIMSRGRDIATCCLERCAWYLTYSEQCAIMGIVDCLDELDGLVKAITALDKF